MQTTLKLLRLAAVAAIGWCMPSAAWAGAAVNKASGGGTVEALGTRETISFTAQVDAAGVAKGQAEFQLRTDNVTFHVEIDCLSVAGRQAWMEGVITSSNDPVRVGTRVQWTVVDNGEGKGAQDASSLVVSGDAGSCSQHPALQTIPWTNGTVQVR